MFYPTLFLLFALMTSVLFFALTTSALPIRRISSQPDVEAREEDTLPPAGRAGIPVVPLEYDQPLGWDDLPGNRGGFGRGRGDRGRRGPRRGPSGRRFDARRK
jgi:hypothetical protein